MLGRIKRKLKRFASHFKKKEYVTVPVYQGSLVKDKTVFITGGATGIGLAMAKSCLNNGANVIICGRTKSKLDTANEELKKISPNVEAYEFDISKFDAMKAGFEAILKATKFKRIDVLINNAGVMGGGVIFPTLQPRIYQRL